MKEGRMRAAKPAPVFKNPELGNCFNAPDPTVFAEKSKFFEAIEYCDGCPIADYCGEWGLTNRVVGTWGGGWVTRNVGWAWTLYPPEWVAQYPD